MKIYVIVRTTSLPMSNYDHSDEAPPVGDDVTHLDDSGQSLYAQFIKAQVGWP